MSEQDESTDEASDADDRQPDDQGELHSEDIVTPRKRARVWPWLVPLVLLMLLAASIMVPVPYYVEGPGSVTATQERVKVTGRKSFTSDGEVMFTTVSERPGTPALLLRAWLDETIDAVPEKDAVPTGNRKQERAFAQKQMDRSKLAALRVAFDHLDIPIEISGTGAFIRQLIPGFPAEKLLDQGDVITAINGTEVTTLDEVRPLLAESKAGDDVIVTVRRRVDSESVDVTVPLAENEEDPSRGYLGVVLETADEKVELPFEVDIDSGSVIGPSAGLAWTLGIIDRLTPGDLTGGRRVAVTGTIGDDGTVGPIGGIAQKVAGAMRAGAKVFLYPDSTDKGEVKRMTAIADGEIELKAVGTIDEALEAVDPGSKRS